VDFSHLQDGVYTGEYEGGLYKCGPTRSRLRCPGKGRRIRLLEAKFEYDEKEEAECALRQGHCEADLQVDAISGATLTSRASCKRGKRLLQAE
jgi:uncharacterized protein with FMN-binding domain